MKKAFRILIFSIIIHVFHPLNSCAQSNSDFLTQMKGDVGEIKFDEKIDRKDFYICHPGYIFQYYAVNTEYRGGKREVERCISKHWPNNPSFSSINGLITIRFVVNCEGQCDRFRVFELDNNYKKVHFNQDFIKQLLRITKSLNTWKPGKLPDGRSVDSYYYFTFRIVNGKLKELMP